MMETILQLTRRMAHNSSPSSMVDMKYSPTDSLKLSNRDNKRIERRKPNWTEAENVFLLDQFGLHREILTCKATDASTNLKKQEIWRVICQNLNTHNTLVRRTPAEVRRKWKNLVTAAKKEVWEMRHQIHLTGGGGPNGRKISELSQRVLQLHSSGGFSGGNPNGLYGTLLSAGLIGPPGNSGPSAGDKYSSKYGEMEDKSFIPAHFTPIITLSESNNNHISSLMMGGNHSGHSGEGPPSPLSEDDNDNDDDESSDSRNATEFMSDSGIYEQEGIDLRVNVVGGRQSVNNYNSSGASGNGRGQVMKHNVNHHDDPDEDDPEEEVDEDGEDIPIISRYSNHLKIKNHSPLNYISSANYHNNNNINNKNHRAALLPFGIGHQEEGPSGGEERKSSETTEEIVANTNNNLNPNVINGDLIDATLKLRNHFIATLKESDLLSNLYKERLELQIEVLKLRKQKLSYELKNRPRGAAINRLIANNFSRVRLAKRRNFFRIKTRNHPWINNNINNIEKSPMEILHKGTNTEVLVNGNSNNNKESDHEEN